MNKWTIKIKGDPVKVPVDCIFFPSLSSFVFFCFFFYLEGKCDICIELPFSICSKADQPFRLVLNLLDYNDALMNYVFRVAIDSAVGTTGH